MEESNGSTQAAVGYKDLIDRAEHIFEELSSLPIDEQIAAINELRSMLHAQSPFREEPVDCVLWVPMEAVQANDYNPNVVAPPEMRLLESSILADGYTQPIVAYPEIRDDRAYTVVDGFHRNRIGKESPEVRARLHGYLPITVIRESQADLDRRMASTIRHNRARGKHVIDGMSEIVSELSKRNWSDARIARELGMESDEVLRLKQITGLAELFAEEEFSEAWEATSYGH